jgi:hypothetical protein
MNEKQFKKDLKIDIKNLEKEAALQPELYFKWMSLAAKANEAYENAKLELDTTEAKISRAIREKPSSFGVRGRLTEARILGVVKEHPKYQEAYKEYLKALSEQYIFNKVQEALHQRKEMIKALLQTKGK